MRADSSAVDVRKAEAGGHINEGVLTTGAPLFGEERKKGSWVNQGGTEGPKGQSAGFPIRFL